MILHLLILPGCRSTILDTWNDLQLRVMKLGGNAAAGMALNCKVGASTATVSKYSSRAASDYKAKLMNRAKADKAASPLDPFAAAPVVASLVKEGNDADDDVFEEAQEDPRPKPVVFNPSPMAAGPVGPMAFKKPAGKLSKLGAVKSIDVDFDQIESKAWEGQVSEKGASVPPASAPISAPVVTPVVAPVPKYAAAPSPVQPKQPAIPKEQEAAIGRLGMGMKKLTLQQQQANAAKSAEPATKSVSSEKFFKQPNEEENFATQEKLKSVRGQTAISSSDFFNDKKDPDDADDEDGDEPYRRSGSASGAFSPKDYAMKLVDKAQSIDVTEMRKSISTAGSKIAVYLSDLQVIS